MQFYFIRHGQSHNNALYARTGSWQGRNHDPDLTDVGRQQAARLARFLHKTDPAAASSDWDPLNAAGFGITHLYTSLMIRAAATGSIVAEALHLPLVAWEDLHEGGGIYLDDEETEQKVGQPGLSRAELETRFPRLVLPDSLNAAGWWNRPFEEPEQRPIRARRFLNDLIERHRHTEDRVAVISHGEFYNHFLGALLKLPERDDFWFELSNTGITRIDFGEEHINMPYANRVDFLPKELIT
jgi:2,3-bisphosphoglycerate-dependent phosphoglycerate mutase